MQQWTTSKKIDLVLVVLGCIALFLGFLDIKKSIFYSPHKVINWGKVISSSSGKSSLTSSELQKIIKLKNTDTDHDGLSDYDEINIYHTNPYLKDTDGDGIPDGQEVKDGTNPNCPQGQKCNNFKTNSVKAIKEATASQQEINKFFSINYPSSTEAVNINQGNSSTSQAAEAARLMSGRANLAEVKQMLLHAGMSQQDLNKIPDKSIMQMYYQMVKDYQQKHSLNNE